MTDSKKVLVVGATGFLGSEICQRLIAKGKPVRGLVRRTSDPTKVERLKSMGVELAYGDLQDSPSLAAACSGVAAVITTATITLSRQPHDSIEATDRDGQLSLVAAAKAAGVRRFVHVSVSSGSSKFSYPVPLVEAKRTVEKEVRASGMEFTILRYKIIMDIWLSPILGFDYPNAKATVYGAGTGKLSWIALGDAAEFAVRSLDTPAARNAVLDIGGPEQLTWLEVITIFEEVGGRPFAVTHVPKEALQAQLAAATDSLSKSVAALMLYCDMGDPLDMRGTAEAFGMTLGTVRQYAQRVLAAQPAAVAAA